MRYGLQGPCEDTVTACAAGTHSIGNAARLIKDGRCDLVVTGGSEAAITSIGVAAFGNMTALSNSGVVVPVRRRPRRFRHRRGAPASSCSRSGTRRSHVGRTILAEVLGSASTADAHHITAPSPGGEGAIRCIRAALDDAGLEPDRHHTDQRARHVDPVERPRRGRGRGRGVRRARAGHHVDQGRDRPLARRGRRDRGRGRSCCRCSTARSRRRWACASTTPSCPKLDVVAGQGRDWEPGPTISNSFGFGGHNGSVVFGPPPA